MLKYRGLDANIKTFDKLVFEISGCPGCPDKQKCWWTHLFTL